MDGILLVNKPKGMTSHDVVNIVRKSLHTKKVGHCGTLDPDATGVLVLCIGKATKTIQFLTSDSKEYTATVSLGQSTDTYDASGKVIEEKEYTGVDEVEKVLKSFLGKQRQLPPIYSAIKVKGKKLYEYARNNEEVEIKPRDIEIDSIDFIKQNGNEIIFKTNVSKGTYIRSLCVDIGKKLGYPAHMSHLVRNRSGHFLLEDCCTIEDVQNNNFELLSIEDAFKDYEHYLIDDETIVYHGKLIESDIDHEVVVVNKEGKVLAIYGPNGQGYLKSIRGLF